MLEIENIDKIKNFEFSYQGIDWIVFGMEDFLNQYRIVFIPKDNKNKRYNPMHTCYVWLSKDKLGGVLDVYEINNENGKSYIEKKHLKTINEMIRVIGDSGLLK